MNRLSIGVFVLTFGCATQQPAASLSQQTSVEPDHNCANISGDYSFWGSIETAGQPTPITFLQRQIRPSRQGVRWVRITPGPKEGDFKVTLLGEANGAIGDDLAIQARCVGGAWEQRQAISGNSDGTWVKSERAWRYSLSPDNSLIVELNEITRSQYFP